MPPLNQQVYPFAIKPAHIISFVYQALSDVARPSHDLKSREGAHGVQVKPA